MNWNDKLFSVEFITFHFDLLNDENAHKEHRIQFHSFGSWKMHSPHQMHQMNFPLEARIH